MRMLDDSKFCFISCVNDDFMYDECQFYLEHLCMPPGMRAEIVAVRNAVSMTAGYQAAMDASDAKYKIYLHQDVFLVNNVLLQSLLDLFRSNAKIGMVGVAGAEKLDKERPIWWLSHSSYGKVYWKMSPEDIQLDVYQDFTGDFKVVAAIDGVFMATQYDLPWRKDILGGWHFYDISQSWEFIEHGYQVAVVGQDEPWLVHNCGYTRIDRRYYNNMEIFKKNYNL